MEQLRQKLGGLSEAEQAQAAASLFGKEAMSGMLAIINGSPADFEKLSNAIDTCSDTVDGYNGTTEKMAAVMQDNLAGQVTILKSQLEELAISFSDILMPTIRSIVSRIQELVDKLNQLDPQTKETIAKIALVAAALGPMLVVLGKPSPAWERSFPQCPNCRPFLCCAEWHRSHYRSIRRVLRSAARHYRSYCCFGGCLCASLENQ